MTKEMSKINGIDVSECAYFNSVTYEEPYCNIDQEHLYTCSSDENCYYKQFKRLQQENEIIKNAPRLELDTSYIRKKELENIKYKQALEEIREVIEMPKYTCKEFLYIRGKINEVLNDN